jgi:hypothetical protein
MRNLIFITIFNIVFSSCERLSEYQKKYQPIAQKAISDWIILNAKYPESYSSCNFDSFEYISFSDFEDKSSDFFLVLKHSYSLKDKDGINKKQSNYFILDDHYKMSIISSKFSSSLGGVPPSTFSWSNQFSDTIVNVHTAGLNQQQFDTRYQDWKFLNQLKLPYEDLDYYDSIPEQHYISKIGKKNNENFIVNRILKVRLYANTRLDNIGLHELGMTLDRLITQEDILLIPVIKSSLKGFKEEYVCLEVDSLNNFAKMTSLNTGKYFISKIKDD